MGEVTSNHILASETILHDASIVGFENARNNSKRNSNSSFKLSSTKNSQTNCIKEKNKDSAAARAEI
jgi:hypothetical protein